jgi:hypothetical protein
MIDQNKQTKLQNAHLFWNIGGNFKCLTKTDEQSYQRAIALLNNRPLIEMKKTRMLIFSV